MTPERTFRAEADRRTDARAYGAGRFLVGTRFVSSLVATGPVLIEKAGAERIAPGLPDRSPV